LSENLQVWVHATVIGSLIYMRSVIKYLLLWTIIIKSYFEHWRRLCQEILGKTKLLGNKGGNDWWTHGHFSIVGGTCPGCS